MNKKEFIPYEESLEMKELGFDEECLGYYTKNGNITNSIGSKSYKRLSAPLYQQAYRWFLKEYNLAAGIKPYDNNNEPYDIVWLFDIIEINWGNDKECHLLFGRREMETFEEAQLECIKRLIKIVQKKKE